MLGFVIVDRQPSAKETAVWLTCQLEGRVGHTNAVVIDGDDERYDAKIWHLTAGRAVVLTDGTVPPLDFKHALDPKVFDGFIAEIWDYRKRIVDAVASYAAGAKSRNLVMPQFPSSRPALEIDDRNEPAYRALSTANYVRDVWSAWLATEEQRLRRAINPRTGKTPWIMPEELGSAMQADFPPEFAQIVVPEPRVKPKWVA